VFFLLQFEFKLINYFSTVKASATDMIQEAESAVGEKYRMSLSVKKKLLAF